MLDEKVKNIFEEIAKGNKIENFQIYKNVLFQKDKNSENWRIVIPKDLTKNLINDTRSKLAHPGVFKTLMYMRQYYYWKNMRVDVYNVCPGSEQIVSVGYDLHVRSLPQVYVYKYSRLS